MHRQRIFRLSYIFSVIISLGLALWSVGHFFAQSQNQAIFLPQIYAGNVSQPTEAVTPTSQATPALTITVTPTLTDTPTPTSTLTPTRTPTLTVTVTPTVILTPTTSPMRAWDLRLDQRGAKLIPAQVSDGQGYWRLVKARWFNTAESAGRHHIFVDTLDSSGVRQTAVPVLITWSDGTETVTTQAKTGEEYAADFAMYSIAPAYKAWPNDGAPADAVGGMGLGEIDDPTHGHHTSYGLTWQWVPAPTATVTATATLTSTPSTTVTPTETPTPTPTPARDWDPRLDQRGAKLVPAQVSTGQGYWRLVKARWFNESESNGRHHIFVDTLDANGTRQIGVALLVAWNDGNAMITTQAKPGEDYAADFGMAAVAPAYSAQPNDGAPADRVEGMGLGEIDDPNTGHLTSYGLTWQWTIATSATTTAVRLP